MGAGEFKTAGICPEAVGTADTLYQHIKGKGKIFYYDPSARIVSDRFGNQIRVKSDLSQVKKENLPIYLNDLFDAYYDITDRFERDCEYDAKEDIIWS